MSRGHVVPFPSRRLRVAPDDSEPVLTFVLAFSTGRTWAIECTIATPLGGRAPLVHATATLLPPGQGTPVPFPTLDGHPATIVAPSDDAALAQWSEAIRWVYGGELQSVTRIRSPLTIEHNGRPQG